METIYEAPMIYTRIEWIWTDEGLEETFVESCEYEGEFVMCGGDGGSSGNGGNGDGNGGNNNNNNKKPTITTWQNITPTPTPTPTPEPEPEPEPEESGLRYVPGEGFKYNTTPERSEAASKAMQYAVILGTLEGSGHEDDPFLMNTTANLRTNDPDYLGDDSSSSGSATTTTSTSSTTGDDTTVVTDDSEEEPESTIGDEAALRRVRRRLRDRMGRRSTRGRGGAETVGTGYTLGG